MSETSYATTFSRAVAALIAGVLVAIIAAQSRVYAALPALGIEDWLSLLAGHLYVIALDFGPSFVLAVLAWFVFDRLKLREFWLAAIVGAVSFYAAPRLYAVIFQAFAPYWFLDIPRLLIPHLSDLLIGSLVALFMWAIAYWPPRRAAVRA